MNEKPSRRECLKTLGAGAFALTQGRDLLGMEQATDLPNVLIIHVDQHRFDCLGVCGNPDILTPHIDSLASDGVRYENSYCPFPVCTPSRYSLLCGQYVHQHRGFNNHCTLATDIPTFPRLMRSAGYKTKSVGKMHFTPTYLDTGFEEMELSEQDGPGRWDDDYHRYLMKRGLVDLNDLEDQRREYREKARPEYRPSFGALVSNLPEEHHSTTWIAERALDTLKSWDNKKPNLLMAGFIKPHHPFDPPAPWHEKYDPSKLTILPGWTNECLERDYLYSHGYFDSKTLTEDSYRKAMAYYYASISQIDHHVGRMIDRLKEKNLYDNTMIVFTSDHGEYMGFHHLMLKGNYMYDPVIRIPLIIKYPQSQQAGTVSKAMVNNIDLAPTILKTSGLEPSAEMKGFDLRDGGSGHSIIFCGRTECVARTQTKKLITTQRERGENLYFDLEKDPFEMENRYDDASCRADIEELQKALDEWQPASYRDREICLDEDAQQIRQPNVPSLDRSHRDAIIKYYWENCPL